MRHALGLDVEQMGVLRLGEMHAVERTLGLTGMTVLDYPDSGLKNIDPRKLERAVETHIAALRPDILVTYAVHGISGFHDHLVTHAVVKRVYLEMKERGNDYLQRLALLTLQDSGEETFIDGRIRLKHSTDEEIDCVVSLREEDREMMRSCLRCYESYQDTIEASGVIEKIGNALYFEFFGERHSPPVDDLCEGL